MWKKLAIAALVLILLVGIAAMLAVRSLLGSESVRARLEQQLAVWTGQPVKVGAASAKIFPRVAVELRNVAVGEPAALSAGRVAIATGLRGLFSRRIEDAEVTVIDGTVTLPLGVSVLPPPAAPPAPPPPTPPTAPRPDSDNAPATPEGVGFTIASVRAITVRNLTILVGKQQVRMEMDSALNGDTLDVSRLTARSERSSLEARGALTSVARIEGAFTAKGDPLDLDELLALASGVAASTPAERGAPASARASSPMHIGLDVTAPKGRLAGYDFTKLAAKIDIKPERIALSPVGLSMFGGEFTGSIDVDAARAAPRFQLKGNVSGIDAAALAATAGSPGAITGRLGGKVSLSGGGTEGDAILRSLGGTADVAVTDGKIPNLDMVRAVVLAFGKPSGAPPEGSGSTFSRLGGTFQLARSTLTTNNLSLTSRDFDMLGRATMSTDGGALDATVNVVLSEELTKQAGTDLRRYAQEDGRVVLPARITGTLTDPAVTIDLASAMGRALQNELKRRGKSLIDQLFKKGRG